MATSAELNSLKSKITAIVAFHGEGASHVSRDVFVGGVDPDGGITYLTAEEFDFCQAKGILARYNPPVKVQSNKVGAPGGGGSSESPS